MESQLQERVESSRRAVTQIVTMYDKLQERVALLSQKLNSGGRAATRRSSTWRRWGVYFQGHLRAVPHLAPGSKIKLRMSPASLEAALLFITDLFTLNQTGKQIATGSFFTCVVQLREEINTGLFISIVYLKAKGWVMQAVARMLEVPPEPLPTRILRLPRC